MLMYGSMLVDFAYFLLILSMPFFPLLCHIHSEKDFVHVMFIFWIFFHFATFWTLMKALWIRKECPGTFTTMLEIFHIEVASVF